MQLLYKFCVGHASACGAPKTKSINKNIKICFYTACNYVVPTFVINKLEPNLHILWKGNICTKYGSAGLLGFDVSDFF